MAGFRDRISSLVKLALQPVDTQSQLDKESIIGASMWDSVIPVDEEWRFHHDFQEGHHELIFNAWKKANPASKVTIRYVIQLKNEIIPGGPAVLGMRKVLSNGLGIDSSELLDETMPAHAQEIATVKQAFEIYLSRVERELYAVK